MEDPAAEVAHRVEGVAQARAPAGAAASDLVLQLAHAGELDDPVLRLLGPVVDPALDVAPDHGKLLGQVVGLV